jgi:hypothetical protein
MSGIDPSFEELRPVDPGSIGSPKEAAQVLCAWCLLALTDLALKLAGFPRFYMMMESWPTVRAAPPGTRPERTRETCVAVDRARTYYFKRAWCLQSAAAAVCFLRLRGVGAELVIGVRKIPFYAHAWAEVDGAVVNNALPEMRTQYSVIARC